MKIVFVLQIVCLVVFAAKPPVAPKKSKLCGNEKCDEVLFKAKVKRVMTFNHEAFLSLVEGALIDVTAVKYSDRTDLMEGVLADGTKGNFYIGAIDIGPYIEFLRDAIAKKKELKEISQDKADIGSKKVLGTVRADLQLVRDYNVQAARYAQEQKLPAPQPIPLPDLPPSGGSRHGHSHGDSHGHGHSHGGAAHGHSHAEDTHAHGHSHGGAAQGHSHVEDAHGHGHSHGGAAQGHSHVEAAHDHGHSHGEAVHIHVHDHSHGGEPPVAESPSVQTEKVAMKVEHDHGHGHSHGEEAHPKPSHSTDQHGSPIPVVKIESSDTNNASASDPSISVTSSDSSVGKQPINSPEATQQIPLTEMEKEIEKLLARDAVLLKEEAAPKQTVVDSTTQSPDVSVAATPAPAPTTAEPLPTPRISTGDILGGAASINLTPQNDAQPTPTTVDPPLTVPPPLEKPDLPMEAQNTQSSPMPSTAPTDSLPQQDSTFPPPESSTVDQTVTAQQATLTADPSLAPVEQPEHQPAGVAEQSAATTELSAGAAHVNADGIGKGEESLLTTTRSPSPVDIEQTHPTSVTPAGVKEADVAEDVVSTTQPSVEAITGTIPPTATVPAEYCSRENCPDENAVPQDPGEGEAIQKAPGAVHGILKTVAAVIRTLPFLDGIGDGGVGLFINVSFLVAAIIIYSISSVLSEYSDAVGCDKMIAHDLATKCKMLDELNKAKDVEINRNELMKGEIEEERRSRELRENDLTSERKRAAQAEDRVSDLRRRLDEEEQTHSRTINELATANLSLERLEKDLRAEKKALEEMTLEQKKTKDAAIKLSMELQSANEEIMKLTVEKSNIELENATLSSMIEEIERNRKEGSGGSGGWSDFGDDIIGDADEEREKTPASSTISVPVAGPGAVSDVREAAKLRVQLKKSEQELETTRMALDYEKQERSRLQSKLSSTEHELERRIREIAERERERTRADERCNELLTIMKDSNAKARETELLRDKLRDDVAILQSEVASTMEEKRKKDEKISELEVELKRMRNEHLKLETKRFSEVLELKHKLDVLMTAQMQPLTPAVQGYDYVNKIERDTVNSPSSLWEEAPRPLSSNRATSPEEDFLFGTFHTTKKGTGRPRRSDRLQMETSPAESEKRKERKETSHRRVRSRSHGRQLWNGRLEDMPAGRHLPADRAAPSAHNPGYEMDPHNRRHNRSVHAYYSSGGSNGGRSPPPEMPLLSAVPPPGLKKPAGKRANGELGLFRFLQ
ncbi:hypothetical protein Q1695_001646 [Nippostrongylus brasiliensis]|nr:hypothetical protein Q1695_001646 [Nippostrongylus brasiliensis]